MICIRELGRVVILAFMDKGKWVVKSSLSCS